MFIKNSLEEIYNNQKMYLWSLSLEKVVGDELTLNYSKKQERAILYVSLLPTFFFPFNLNFGPFILIALKSFLIYVK